MRDRDALGSDGDGGDEVEKTRRGRNPDPRKARVRKITGLASCEIFEPCIRLKWPGEFQWVKKLILIEQA